MKYCINCNTELPDVAKFCMNCGTPQPDFSAPTNQVVYSLDHTKDVKQQIVDQFFKALKSRIEEQHKPTQHKDYVELIYQTGFRETVHLRAEQLAEEINRNDLSFGAVSALLEDCYTGLLDYFIIHHGKSLNQIRLPEAILKYEGLKLNDISLSRMIFDYLDFGNEEETVYSDFLQMPSKKIKNASQSFLFADQKERIYFICDQSLLGSCKEGFAMTEVGLYWKFQFHSAERVYYNKIRSVTTEKSWININEMFFNVNPSINIKMLKLLRKLKRLHELS